LNLKGAAIFILAGISSRLLELSFVNFIGALIASMLDNSFYFQASQQDLYMEIPPDFQVNADENYSTLK
jgi:hypothetical protein